MSRVANRVHVQGADLTVGDHVTLGLTGLPKFQAVLRVLSSRFVQRREAIAVEPDRDDEDKRPHVVAGDALGSAKLTLTLELEVDTSVYERLRAAAAEETGPARA